MKVKVYRNLRRNCYSVMSRGKVIRHTATDLLLNVKFNVRARGRDRVRQEKRKNVHAFVEGNWPDNVGYWPDYSDLVKVTYNPYKNDTFVLEDGTPIYSAKFAILNSGGCWISTEDARIANWNAFCEKVRNP